MGSYGSTRWGSHRKRDTVEDSIKVSINDFRKYIPRQHFETPGQWSGLLFWTRGERVTASLAYGFEWQQHSPVIILDYRHREQPIKTTIRLITTPCHFGNVRWWFECPHCKRRAGCLYVAPGASLFACRLCYDLTYQSSQEAHKFDCFDRLFGLGSLKNIDGLVKMQLLADKWMRRERLTRWEKRKLKKWWAELIARRGHRLATS